jgi:hypothetical protein
MDADFFEWSVLRFLAACKSRIGAVAYGFRIPAARAAEPSLVSAAKMGFRRRDGVPTGKIAMLEELSTGV